MNPDPLQKKRTLNNIFTKVDNKHMIKKCVYDVLKIKLIIYVNKNSPQIPQTYNKLCC